MNGADRNRTILSVLLLHDAKIVLSMLVEILGFNDFTASRRILRHRCVPFVVVAGILNSCCARHRAIVCLAAVGSPGDDPAASGGYWPDLNGSAVCVGLGPR